MGQKVKCRIEFRAAPHTVAEGGCPLGRIGIWEGDEGVFAWVTAKLKALGRDAGMLVSARHPAELARRPAELLVIAPGAVGWAGAGAVRARMVLLPGSAGPLLRTFEAESAVSYGTSPRDTITVSSVEGGQICIAIQRELVTVRGGVVDRQELVLALPQELEPLPFLAAAGTLLLLGVPAEQIG